MAVTFVAHYSEVALKGKNRPEFVRVLRRNILRSLHGLEPTVRNQEGRLFIECGGQGAEVSERHSRVFGLAWYSEVKATEPSFEAIKSASLELARQGDWGTFKVEARRTNKAFPMSSYQIASQVGEAVIEATGKSVDLSGPDLRIHVDVLKNGSMVYSNRTKGLGGLPVGTSGRVVHLFSGGIDSPPSAWLLMKRGCRPVYLHFYLAPTPEYPLASKVVKLVKLLAGYGGKCTLVLVPFADYQVATLGVPAENEPSLFRRFMRMTAERLASFVGASAISTGDSLAQAASQTIWNIGTFDSGCSFPVLRPLLTYDKEEVVTLAKRIGTYDLSLEEYKDCCAIVSRSPRTRAKAEQIAYYARSLSFETLVSDSLKKGTLVSYAPSGDRTKVIPLSDAMDLSGPHAAILAAEEASSS